MGFLWGGTKHSDGKVQGFGEANNIEIENTARAKVGGTGVGGNERWNFASPAEANNFLQFFKCYSHTIRRLVKNNNGALGNPTACGSGYTLKRLDGSLI
mmetsp:Transcript_45578/g.89777  ORF Transcript_45578/g.89777 Transcript_45578/m.89777 type:complete len:99 (-) Transcript_45578:896-1192(-)